AYQQSAALKAGVELDIFTGIADGHRSVKALASHCRASERGIRILADTLTIMGFLTKDAGGYGLTGDSAVFLTRKSPAYIGTMVNFLQSSELTGSFKQLSEVVRKGTTMLPDQGTVTTENPIWIEFARSMAALTTMPAEAMCEMVGLDRNRP